MISEKLSSIIKELESQGKMMFLEGATEEQISIFENENKIVLPSEYKEWLQFSDGGECFLPAGVQFYGVEHKPLIDPTDDDKPDNSYTIIGALASGDPILCQVESDLISIYNHEAGIIEDDEIYEDFFSFLDALCDLLGIGE